MTATRRTAAQVILQAAGTLPETFTEWDLTFAAWKLDREKFGLRGYHNNHPDHKRVSMEIMGRKPNNPIVLGYMRRVAPNTYRVTDLGRAELARLSDGPNDDHAAIRGVLDSPDFLRWQSTQERPTRRLDHAEALAGIFRRHAGQYVTGRPGTPGWRPAVTPEQIGEGLAFLEVAMQNGSRARKRSA